MDYPRVTEVLKAYTSYDKVPREILERASASGSSVHALCAGIAKGAWIPDSMISADLTGYIDSFKKWVASYVEEFVVVEKRYADDDLRYTGQLDFVISSHDKELYLVDLKTSARPQATYPIQMGAYDNLLRKHQVKVKGAILVYLNKDGEFPKINLISCMKEEFNIFISALTCYHYFNKGKNNGNKYSECDSRIDGDAENSG